MINNVAVRGKRSERGSALLIVFLFAAVIAIMLYREMPVSAFEAQRQKEQLLIDRGLEYKRAVKLYYIKFGTYPGSIDQLENTNRMRFLRHRFKDPFTGKDDWRLLHMGPGGMLVDSKVNPLKNGSQNGSSFAGNNIGSGTEPAANDNSGAGGQAPVSLGQPMAYMTPGQPVVYHNYPGGVQGGPAGAMQVRPPAIPANSGQQQQQGNQQPGSYGPDPTMNDMNSAGNPNGAGLMEPSNVGPTGSINGFGPQGPGGNDAVANIGQQQQQGFSQGLNGQPQQQGFGGLNGGNGAQRQTSPGMNAVQNLLQQNNQQANQQSAFGSNAGRLNSGGLAGVASKIEGRGIKTVEDQSDYSKWEFYYDPRKDVVNIVNMSNAGGGVQNPGGPNYAPGPYKIPDASAIAQATGNNNGVNNNSNNMSAGQNGFGRAVQGQNGFGQNGNGMGQQQNVFGPPIPGQGQIPVPVQTVPQQQQQQQLQQQLLLQQQQQQEQEQPQQPQPEPEQPPE